MYRHWGYSLLCIPVHSSGMWSFWLFNRSINYIWWPCLIIISYQISFSLLIDLISASARMEVLPLHQICTVNNVNILVYNTIPSPLWITFESTFNYCDITATAMAAALVSRNPHYWSCRDVLLRPLQYPFKYDLQSIFSGICGARSMAQTLSL